MGLHERPARRDTTRRRVRVTCSKARPLCAGQLRHRAGRPDAARKGKVGTHPCEWRVKGTQYTHDLTRSNIRTRTPMHAHTHTEASTVRAYCVVRPDNVHRIAGDAEHVAAEAVDRRDQAREHTVEHVERNLRREPETARPDATHCGHIQVIDTREPSASRRAAERERTARPRAPRA